ncbi:MAG: hypothetical protein CO119_06370 [Flavobacteriales bacterium CG_4_9_14_3_um_filter_40_17]|nr:MAG: hypothetical protein CO119_06370 [Flavobacteriales bacterium CG_4_9_14_3_um_filter_40_17]
MKKKLEAELVSLAHQVLQLSGRGNLEQMYQTSRKLYEQLALFRFVENHFNGSTSTLTREETTVYMEELFQTTKGKVDEQIDTNEQMDELMPDQNPHQEDLIEPLMETIKDMVAQMPSQGRQIDDLFEEVQPSKTEDFLSFDFDEIAKDYRNLPTFEEIGQSDKMQVETKPKSVNDVYKTGLQIGLNDKIAFIKNLFDGETDNYNRVISQLNTLETESEAKEFINQIVKPDYNNWEGKELYEARLIALIEAKFN